MKNKDYLKGITQKWTSKNKTGQNKTGQNKTDQNKTDKQNFQESIYNITRLEPAATIGERKKAKLLKKTAWWKNQLGKNQCYYCKKKFHPDELTMDHKISLSRGGKSIKKNVVPSCKNCNQNKKHLLPLEVEI